MLELPLLVLGQSYPFIAPAKFQPSVPLSKVKYTSGVGVGVAVGVGVGVEVGVSVSVGVGVGVSVGVGVGVGYVPASR